MADWDGRERRSYAEVREIIREEIEPLRQSQEELKRKISDWENGAKLFRAFVIGTVALFTAAAAVWEWIRDHLK